MRVIVTKYALTSGVQIVEARASHVPTMVSAAGSCFHKPHWHTSKAEAVYQLGKMAAGRRKSLRLSLSKLDSTLASALQAVQTSDLD